MRVLSTVFFLIAAFALFAMPMMACCVSGHVETHSSMTQMAANTAPTCHETGESRLKQTEYPEKFCSACDDCAMSAMDFVDFSPVIQAQAAQDWTVLVHAVSWTPRPEMRRLQSTGPPLGGNLPPVDSPLSTSDRLLI